MSAYEQNTQQSPGTGLRNAPQVGHSQKNWQASRGMRACVADPHAGQVIVASYRTALVVDITPGNGDIGAAHPHVAAVASGVTRVFSSCVLIVAHSVPACVPVRAMRQRGLAGRIRSQNAARTMITSPA